MINLLALCSEHASSNTKTQTYAKFVESNSYAMASVTDLLL